MTVQVPRLPAPLTGYLTEPVIACGQAYCSADFPWRAAEWFRQEERRGPSDEEGSDEAGLLPKEAPTRVQPSRAAKTKRKREITEERQEKRSRTTYTLDKTQQDWTDDASTDASVTFRRIVARVLADAEAADAKKKASAPCVCALAAQPLACAGMAFCLHGLCAEAEQAGHRVSVAPMEPSNTTKGSVKVARRRFCAKYKQVVCLCGLRFVVDTCAGTRVVMV